jgi:hypothetical protein
LERSAPNLREIDRLVVLKPKRVELLRFDRVEQRFAMDLYDENGRDVRLEVKYSEKESGVIGMLEGLEKQVRGGIPAPVFFGILSREDARIKFYPIEYFTDWEVGP